MPDFAVNVCMTYTDSRGIIQINNYPFLLRCGSSSEAIGIGYRISDRLKISKHFRKWNASLMGISSAEIGAPVTDAESATLHGDDGKDLFEKGDDAAT